MLDHCLDSAAAALAAVADGIESVEHGIFEPGRMQVPAFMFSPQQFQCFCLGESPGSGWMVLQNKVYRNIGVDWIHVVRRWRAVCRAYLDLWSGSGIGSC
jgi:hypothetical protein